MGWTLCEIILYYVGSADGELKDKSRLYSFSRHDRQQVGSQRRQTRLKIAIVDTSYRGWPGIATDRQSTTS